MWSKLKPDVEFQYGGRLYDFNGVSSHSHLPHCRVLPPGEFSVMIPELRVTFQGVAIGRIQWHVIPEPRITSHGCCHLVNSLSIFFCFKCSLGFDEWLLSYRVRYTLWECCTKTHINFLVFSPGTFNCMSLFTPYFFFFFFLMLMYKLQSTEDSIVHGWWYA